MNNLLNENTKIIIFGCGNTARDFLSETEGKINVSLFWSNDNSEREYSSDQGKCYVVNRPCSKDKIDNDYLIIICSIYFDDIAEQLQLLGFIPFRDFIDDQIAKTMFSEKKIALMYGACHLRAVKDALMTSLVFSDQYEAFYFPNYLQVSVYESMKLCYIVEHCSLFLYGISVEARDYRKNKALLDRISKNVQIISIPIICFGGYFPQLERPFNRMNRYAIKCEGKDYTPFSYEDSFLNRCIDEGLSVDTILEKIADGNVYEQSWIRNMLDDEWKRVRFQESDSDIKALSYISDNYKKRRLFRNEAHMENAVIYHYAEQIIAKLGFKPNFDKGITPFFYCSEHPIYGCTSRAIGLEWNVMDEVLDLYTYEGWKRVSVYEFIEAYIESGQKIRELKEKGLLPYDR